MSAYYNEVDPEKAEWIRELIKASVVAPGDVDERSITDVRADDLRGYTQCHFFAGIGVWSYALRLAGWPDEQPVWTGSCPCPSFSSAGKGEGFDDARHLWPAWYSLIRECRPGRVFGEQVAAAIGHGWLDLVCGDMEAEEYAIAAAVLGAHSAGAPHIRQRLYFVADTPDSRRNDARKHGSGRPLLPARPEQCGGAGLSLDTSRPRCEGNGLQPLFRDGIGAGENSRLAGPGSTSDGSHSERDGRRSDLTIREAEGRTADGRDSSTGDRPNSDGRQSSDGDVQRSREQRLLAQDCGAGDGSDSTERGFAMRGSTPRNPGHAALTSETGGSDNPLSARLEGHFGDVREWRGPGWLNPHTARSVATAGATRGFWADCDWWYGRDGKWRPIGEGITPLIGGAAKSGLLKMASRTSADLRLVRDLGETEPQSSEARVLRLKGYGDSIVAEVAAEFIQAYIEGRNV